MESPFDLAGDERGVSGVIGFILVFAILMILLSINQAQVVPAENSQVEYQHSQAIQGQLQELRNGILTAAGTGSTSPVSVQLGTQYPTRMFAVNPPPASGQLRTEAVGSPPEITVSNAIAASDTETRDYWNGDNRSFETRAIVYQPTYHAYKSAPNATIIENTLLYKQFENGATIAETDQTLIQDHTITLVAINGSLERSSAGSLTVDPRAISGAYQEVSITNTSDGPLQIQVPSHVDASEFENMTGVTVTDAGGDRLTLTLTDPPYKLRMAKIGMGTGTTEEGPHYITWEDAPSEEIQAGSYEEITVEVRDRFNNPVNGVDTVDQAGTLDQDSQVTNEKGQATFNYTAPSTPTEETINISIGDNPSDKREWVNKTVDVTQTTGTGTGNGSSAYTIDWQDPSDDNTAGALSDCSDTQCTWDESQDDGLLKLRANTSPELDGLSVDLVTNDSSVGSLDPNTGTTSSGTVTTEVVPASEGWMAAYVASGGSSDVIDIFIQNLGLQYLGDATAEDNADDGVSVDRDGGVTFSLENQYGEPIEIQSMNINPENDTINAISDKVGNGDDDPGETEIFADASSGTDAWVDYQLTNEEYTAVDAEGLTVDFDNPTMPDVYGGDGTVLAKGANPAVQPGETVEFSLFEFYAVDNPCSGGCDATEVSNVNMSGEEMTIEVDYTVDGGPQKTREFTFTVGGTGGGGGFAVNIDSTNSPVTSGDDVDVTFTVQNNGETSESQQITLSVEGQNNPVDQVQVSLNPDETTQETLSWSTESNDHNDSPYTVTISSNTDTDTDTVEVNNKGNQGGN